jgi:hypothetical protein
MEVTHCSGLLADQAMTANMTLRLAAEDEAAEAAELAVQEGWTRRRDPRAEAFRQQQQARARSISAVVCMHEIAVLICIRPLGNLKAMSWCNRGVRRKVTRSLWPWCQSHLAESL